MCVKPFLWTVEEADELPQVPNDDMLLRSCFEIEMSVAKSCGVFHLPAPTHSVCLVLVSLSLSLFPASSHSHWVIWAYESLQTAFCQDPNQLIFAHQHTCHALCVCVCRSLEMTPLPTSLFSLLFLSLLLLTRKIKKKGPKFLLLSFSFLKSPAPSSLPLKWVVFMADESRVSLTATSTGNKKNSHLPCLFFSSFEWISLYMPHFFSFFLSVLRGNVTFDWALSGLVIRRLWALLLFSHS